MSLSVSMSGLGVGALEGAAGGIRASHSTFSSIINVLNRYVFNQIL